jgi:hypothetical protein
LSSVEKKHPSTPNTNPQPKESILRTTSKKKLQSITSALTDGTATSPPATVSDSPTSTTATTPAPASAIDLALQTMAPPVVDFPVPPTGFAPVNLLDFRGSHPKAGQIAALPGALHDLASAIYVATFGPAAPSASKLAGELTIASEWTTMRSSVEQFLIYVKSLEAITWKAALSDLEKLDAIFQILVTQNPAVAAEFPGLDRLLNVPKVISQRAAATRARRAKEKAQAATPATGAQPAPAVSPSTASSGSGGATH